MRWQDIGLVLLAAVAAGLTLLSFRAVTSPSDDSQPGGPVAVAPSDDGAPPGTDPDGSTATPDAAAAAGDRGPTTSSLSSVRALLDTDEQLVVAALGDSTGNETWEWVYGWARLMAGTRPVTVVSWNEWTEDGYIEPRVLSEPGNGRGGPVVVYSGHQSGARAGYVVDHLDRLLPERPDLVILNFGHNNTAADIRDELDAALAALRSEAGPQVPVVLTLQQPQRGDANADVRRAVRAFADEHGLGVIDVAAAFEDSGDPEALLADAVHPNEAGAAVWAETVARTLRAP